MKKVSVVIPAYNKAELTVKTVESVLSQTYKNIEIIVVDDGSTDNTKDLLKPYVGKIQYIHKDNGGACSARNVGIRKSTGEYICLIDCDDTYLPKKIEKSVAYLEKHPECGFVHTAAYLVDEKGNIITQHSHKWAHKTGWISKYLLFKNFICNSTVVIRKSCFEKVGLFDEEIFTPGDWDMWLRLSENYKVGYISKPLTKYMVSSSFIFNNLIRAQEEELKVIGKIFKRFPQMSKKLKGKIMSSFYLRHALNYLLTKDFEKTKKYFSLALKNNCFNFKAVFLYIYFLVYREGLCSFLGKRILFGQ